MRKNLLFVFILFISLASQIYAETLLREGHPDRYVVKKGDTLWDIASMFLEDPWLWPEIWRINPEVENPHLIYPGDVILLSYVNGEPSIVVVRPDGGEPVLDVDDLEKTAPLPDRPARRTISRRTLRETTSDNKLKPRIRVSTLSGAIPAIPLDAIGGLLTRGRIVSQKELKNAPYILSGSEDNLIFGPGDVFYARGKKRTWQSDAKVYGVYKGGEVYRDPVSGKVLGTETREVGLARMTDKRGDLATFDLVSVAEDVRLGDKMLPTEERRLDSTFFPTAPEVEIEAVIMKVIGGMSQIGKYDVVAINKGTVDGLEVGNILKVSRSGKKVDDPNRFGSVRLPPRQSGLLMVFRMFEKMSYGLVLRANLPLRVGDPAVTP